MAKAQEPAISEGRKLDIDVMNAMQGVVPSQKGSMDVMKALKSGFDARKTGIPFEMFAAILGARLRSPRNSLVQIGNTVFMVKRDPENPKEIKFVVTSGESPKLIAKNFSGFYKFLKNQGISKATGSEESPELIKAYQSSGVPMKIGQKIGFYGKERKPEYSIELDLRGE